MSIKKVLCYPDPRLRTKAKPITNFSDELQTIIDDMLETMYEHNGVGLAATQVDVHLRLIVMDTSENRNEPLIIINPEILEEEGVETFMEGCISFPGVYDKITRAARIKFRAQNRHGEVYEMYAEELFAECVQHEMDHLEGKLMIDYLSPLKRERLVKKMKKLQQQTL